jgi:D-alanyl-D-alanine carboxypeptidase
MEPRRVTRGAVVLAVTGGHVAAVALFLALAGCGPASDATDTTASPSGSFPTAAFAELREGPVAEEVADEFRVALSEMAGGGGMAATVMFPDGTWSGAVGKADGLRDVRVNDQFAIASVTKPVIAAQVMQMVEAGELDLDDPASDHLPPDLDFDTNGATIRHLLAHRSGIPDYYPVVHERLSGDRLRVWTPTDLLELVPTHRSPVGEGFEYTDTNYLLLGLVIEQVRGRPVADVLRDGVLSIDGVERLIYQPDERPTEPMAMPEGESRAALKKGGGYLPSLAHVTSDGPGAAMASDSLSLARWWRAFCAGEILSEDSLTEMTTFYDGPDGYGLGLFNVADPYEQGVGHTGDHDGYVAWAGCLPEVGSVVVVLSNRVVEDKGGLARPLVIAERSD